jgi:KDO2-lipid IV(A) lauroyltransferase
MPRLALWGPKYWLTWIGLGAMRLVALLPYARQLPVGRAIGRLVRRLPLAYVRIARCNLQLCFPELGAAEREDLLDRHFESLGIGVCEAAMTWWASDAEILAISRLEGLEHLERALAAGRGAIMIGGHFTTIEIAARILNAAVPLSPLYRPTKNRVLAEALQRNRSRFASEAIPHDSIRAVISALRRNRVVWYPPDQSYRNKGAAMVNFFGIPAATTTATSRLAQISGAAVLTYFTERLPEGRGYRAVIGPPLENFPSADPVADTERYNRLLEAHIRRVPEQYLWMHRRFKGLTADYPDYYGRDSRRRAPVRAPA